MRERVVRRARGVREVAEPLRIVAVAIVVDAQIHVEAAGHAQIDARIDLVVVSAAVVAAPARSD